MKQGMKIKAIIEKGNDGMYSIRCEEHINNHYFGGFGSNVAEAKEDFKESVEEVKKETQFNEDIQISYCYDMPSFFNYFDYLNISKFAAYAGLNESKMRQYKCGAAYPSEKTLRKIANAAERIGAELSSVSL